MRRNHFIVCSMFLLLGSCVSVEIPGKKVLPAKDVHYKEPAEPFKTIKMKNVDKAWLSKKSGNTISYYSECGTDPSLEQIETDVLSAMNDPKVIKTNENIFNGRAARETVATGDVDGVPVKMSILVFKRNGCNFTLSYGGTDTQFASEEALFENFKKDFRAP